MNDSPRVLLEALHARALAAVDAGEATAKALAVPDGVLHIAGRPVADGAELTVIAAGKAACAMAEAVERIAGERIRDGLVITKDGYGSGRVGRLPVREAAHPVPDGRGEAAAEAALSLAGSAQ